MTAARRKGPTPRQTPGQVALEVLLAVRQQLEPLARDITALRQALENTEAPTPLLTQAVTIESGLLKVRRIVRGE
jgi:hypothetical protein